MAYMASSDLPTPNWPKIVGHSVPDWLVPAINRVPELLQLLKSRDMKADKLTTGVVQAVGLHKLKAQHAKNWQRLKKNVHIIIEAEIRRNINAKDVTVIQIKNAAIAKGYLEHFELLWNQATLYNPK